MEPFAPHKDSTRPDLASTLALAGEYKRLLSGCEACRPLGSNGHGRPLPAPAARLLDAATLENYFGTNGAAGNGQTGLAGPEFLDRVSESLRDLLDQAREETAGLRQKRKTFEERLERIRQQIGRLDEERAGLENRLEGLRSEYRTQADDFRHRQPQSRSRVQRLEQRLNQHLESLVPGGIGGEAHDFQALSAERRTEYQALQVRLEQAKAGIGRSRLALQYQAARIEKLALDVKRRQDKSAGLERFGKSLQAGLTLIDRRLADLEEKQTKYKKSEADVEQARRTWTGLKNRLLSWPGASRKLHRQAAAAALPTWSEHEETLTAAQRAIEENRRAESDQRRRIEETAAEGRSLIQGFADFRRRAAGLSEEIDLAVQGLGKLSERPAERPADRSGDIAERLKSLRAEKDLLETRMQGLAAGLTEQRSALDTLGREGDRLTEKHSELVNLAVSSIRAQATRRGVLVRRVGRLRNELNHLHAGLPALLGNSPYLYGCLLSSVLRLARAERELLLAKDVLAEAHDRLSSSNHESSEKAGTDRDELSEIIVRLSDHTAAEELSGRLLRQLSIYRTVLNLSVKITELKDGQKKRLEQLTQLVGRHRRLAENYRQNQAELAALAERGNRLENERAGIGEKIGRLDLIRERLMEAVRARHRELKAFREAEHPDAVRKKLIEEMGRLTEEKNHLIAEQVRREVDYDRLNRERRTLAAECQKAREEIAALKESGRRVEVERNFLIEDESRDRRELARLEKENQRLVDEVRAREQELTRMAYDHQAVEAHLYKLRDQMDRLTESKKTLEEQALARQEDLKKLALQQRAFFASHDRLAENVRRLNFENSLLREERQQRDDEREVDIQERDSLRQALDESQNRLDNQGRRIEKLAQVFKTGRAAHRNVSERRRVLKESFEAQSAELKRVLDEKGRLEADREQVRADLERLVGEKDRIEQDRLVQREEIARLAESRSRLEAAFQAGTSELDRLTLEKKRLLDTNAKYKEKVASLSEQRGRLLRMLDRSRRRINSLVDQRRRLFEDLTVSQDKNAQNESLVQDTLFPLVQLLGAALYSSQVQAADAAADKGRLKERIEALTVLAAEMEAGKDRAETSGRRLGRALNLLGLENDHLRRELDLEQENSVAGTGHFSALLEDAEAERDGALGLIRRQSEELQAYRSQLAEIHPWLTLSLEKAGLAAGADNAGLESLPALFDLLRHENDALKEKVAVLEGDNQSLALDRDLAARGRESLKKRLDRLEPILKYFWSSWMTTAAELAQSQADRGGLRSELSKAREDYRSGLSAIEDLTGRLRSAEQGLAQTWNDLAQARTDRQAVLKAARKYKSLLAQTESRMRALETANREFAGQAAVNRTEAAEMENYAGGLLARNRELEAEDDGALKLFEEREAELDALARQAAQATDRELAADDLVKRARAAQVRFKARLEAQVRTVYALERRVEEQAGRIAELEQSQDRMGLLLWTITQCGGGNPEVIENLERLTREQGFKDAAGIAMARMQQITGVLAARLTGRRFKKAAGQAFRRGLLSLLLAGGIVFASPQESSKAAALTSNQPQSEVLSEVLSQPPVTAPPASGPVFSGRLGRPFDVDFLSPWEKTKGFDFIQERISEEIDDLADKMGVPAEDYLVMIRSSYEPGLTVSLPALKEQRNALVMLKGHFPNIFKDYDGQELDKEIFERLYQMAGVKGAVESRFWDRLYADYRNLGVDREAGLTMILNNIGVHATEEETVGRIEFVGALNPIPEIEALDLSGFTRLIAPYIKANLRAFTSHAAFAGAHKPEDMAEYAKQLAEDMFVSAKAFGVPRTLFVSIAHQETYFANVLGDNSMSASPFQIYRPTKPYIIKSMEQKGLKTPGVPDRLQDHLTLATYMAANYLSDLIRRSSIPWGKNKGLICDLDDVALGYNGGSHYPPAVNGKKLRLVRYLDRIRQMAVQKKTRPRA